MFGENEMTVVAGLIYCFYLTCLGIGARCAFNLISKKTFNIEQKTEFFAHTFFQGVFIHIVLLNLLQLINLSNSNVIIIVVMAFIFSLTMVARHTIKSSAPLHKNPSSKKSMLILGLVVLCSLVIYWNGSTIPNLAWDSWSVWEGKADQWLAHGMSVKMNHLDAWLIEEKSIFNISAHYPDGLSLLVFTPMLMGINNSEITLILYLYAFAMMSMLLVARLKLFGAPFYLQLLLVFVLYTTPLLNNHLMIQGYADIWMAMFVTLITLTFIDYHEKGQFGLAVTLVCYLSILPMIKLEGWIWLILFIISHLLVSLLQHKNKVIYLLLALVVTVILFVSGGINLFFEAGNLIINSDRIEIFKLINTNIEFNDITENLIIGFFWQNNWSLLWVGLPFLIFSFFTKKHSQASQIAHIFIILALLCFLFLFYFTEASQWAQDLTALNRIVLQLTPCYVFLLFKMITRLKGVQQPEASKQPL